MVCACVCGICVAGVFVWYVCDVGGVWVPSAPACTEVPHGHPGLLVDLVHSPVLSPSAAPAQLSPLWLPGRVVRVGLDLTLL